MHQGLFVVGLAIAVVILGSRLLSARVAAPYPVFLVLAGAGASYLPGLPAVRLDPNVVFLIFLPPLVYHTAFVSSARELRANAMPIGLSALGLVMATTAAVAVAVGFAEHSLAWAPAVVLGAAVAPTDPVAATAVLTRLGAPRRLTVILQGESLVNDGIALTLLSVGIQAVGSPTSISSGVLTFVEVALGGTAFGLAVGWLMQRVRGKVTDQAAQIVLSLLVPFLAYVPANSLGLSGVLAAVSAGLYLGQTDEGLFEPAGRLQAEAFWEVLTFLAESGLFVLLGLQSRLILEGIQQYPTHEIVLVVLAALGGVLLTRLAWEGLVPTLRWRPEGRLIDTGGISGRARLVLGWSGVRGAISLAAALSIPVTVHHRPFPGRNLILFSTFCVIAWTLVGQGVTLPVLVARLGLGTSDLERDREAEARQRLLEAAVQRLDDLADRGEVDQDSVELLRQVYDERLATLRAARAELETEGSPEAPPRPHGNQVRNLQEDLARTQRQLLTELYRKGEVSYTLVRRLRRQLDLEQASRSSRH